MLLFFIKRAENLQDFEHLHMLTDYEFLSNFGIFLFNKNKYPAGEFLTSINSTTASSRIW